MIPLEHLDTAQVPGGDELRLMRRGADGTDQFTATAELAAEIAFLIAVAAFTDNP